MQNKNRRETDPIKPAFLRKDDAAAYLSISPRTLSAWMRRGIIPFSKPARKVCLIAVRDLDRLMDRSCDADREVGNTVPVLGRVKTPDISSGAPPSDDKRIKTITKSMSRLEAEAAELKETVLEMGRKIEELDTTKRELNRLALVEQRMNHQYTVLKAFYESFGGNWDQFVENALKNG